MKNEKPSDSNFYVFRKVSAYGGEIPGDGIDNDGNGYIDDTDGWNFYKDTNVLYNSRSSTEDAHGTNCAGTIIANDESIGITGIAGGFEFPDGTII